jgi:hypothetical protein
MNDTGSTAALSAPAPAARALTGGLLSMLFRSAGIVVLLSLPTIPGSGPLGDQSPTPRVEQQRDPLWKTSYSERYPGCVPSILWPADEHPVALVTRTPGGRVDQVALDAQGHLVGAVPAGARTIGACR